MLIDLSWDGRPDFWAVRGHVDDEAAIAEVRACLTDDEEYVPETFVVRHRWARWLFDDGVHILNTYPNKAPGRFKVTVLEDADEVARHEQIKANEAAGKKRITAKALEQWPGIEITWCLGGWLGGSRSLKDAETPYLACVHFTFPGGAGSVSWAEDEDHVHVETRDLLAWNRFIEGVRR